MRSAVPLGGISTGNVEFRADGSFWEWTIINQSPAGAAKFAAQDNTWFAVSAGQAAAAVRTHPPQGVRGVQEIQYQGAYPVSRHSVTFGSSSFDVGVNMTSLSAYRINNLTHSARPAATFILTADNPNQETRNVRFAMQLSIAMEQDMARHDPNAKTVAAPNAVLCRAACLAASDCQSWTWGNGSGCALSQSVPFNTYVNGSFSGVKSSWSKSQTQAATCLTLNNVSPGPTQGNVSICVPATAHFTFGTYNSSADAFNDFSSGTLNAALDGAFGIVSATFAVPASSAASLPIVMSWYYPDRNHLDESIGNLYTTFWKDSVDAAGGAFELLSSDLDDITNLHTPFFASDLPEWLQDSLVNSLSHIRTAWWTRDGRWRQWEAPDCVNIDSVHNDGERHLPYIFFFPEATRNKMAAWGQYALADGMIQEQLGCGCMGPVPKLDDACGRVMSDVTTMFIMYALELYRWSNDTATLNASWPHIVNGLNWQISTAKQYGLPAHLVATYDILGLDKYNVATYNGVFHLMAMAAGVELAKAMGDATLQNACQDALVAGQQALDQLLWQSNGSYYAAADGVMTSLMADSFYGQVLAYSAGLGTVAPNVTRMLLHLAAEEERNDTPYGLRVVTGPPVGGTNNCVWQGGSPNWCTLHLRANSSKSVADALNQPYKSLNNWRDHLADIWDTAGLSGPDGFPYITSHYGFHMVEWHIPLAMSGQLADLPKGTLSFAPRLQAPATLPVMLPGVLGTISITDGHFTLALTVGELTLSKLSLWGQDCSQSAPIHVSPGSPVTCSFA